ncbi:restriction endonuclease subunit S [Chryseobacterium fluminis]|uniref:restriction endonuclease subunit S n=1 Tax=Chryseobacterium fluminis TaxID=2983606 RepID=UPI002253BBCD|nr:restriction endonuclease subunit S [Chryseobacterium sp. MMS21-Ot14]UZT97048.1 restriction endonuclease subunit S [Chryseobacterium sp. MMS21-Ot14]
MVFKKYKLSELLIRKKDQVKLVPDAKFKRITIRMNHKGVVLRDEEFGSKIKSTMFKINGGDFVLSGIDARNGAFGIVPSELDGAIITNDFWCLTPNENLLDKHFFLFLTSTKFFDHICKISSDGTTQRIRLQKDKFFNFEISIPEIKYQKELVQKFSDIRIATINLKKEHNEQIVLINQLRQAFLREAMQGKLVSNETSDGKTGAELLQEIQAEKEKLIKEKKIKKSKPLPPISDDEILLEIPDNWIWCRLGDIISYTDNLDVQKRLASDTVINYVDIDAIDNKKYIIKEAKQKKVSELSSRARRILKKDYLIYSTVRPYLKNIAIIEESLENYIGSTGFVVFKTHQCLNKFVFYFLLNPVLNKEFEELMVGFNSPSISNDTFENTLFPLPSLEIQNRIVIKLDELMNYCDELEKSVKESQNYNEQLLQQVLREVLEGKNEAENENLQLVADESPIYSIQNTINKNCDTGDMAILAGYIIKKLSTQNSKDFGRVKLQKMLHLVEYHCQLSSELKYQKNVAGPYAWELEHVIEPKLKSLRFFEIKKDDFGKASKVTYTPLSASKELPSLFNREFKDQAESINNLLDKFQAKTWEFCEMISTMYAVWNNRLIKKELFTDDILKQDFLDWDDKKKRFIDQLDYALEWIRKEKIEPVGFGEYIDKK